MGSHLAVNLFEFLAQQGDALSDDSFIGLNLRFTHTTAGCSTTALAVQVRPHTGQTGQHILQVRHLHLCFSIGGLRTMEENLQNEDRAVNHANRLLVVVLNLVLVVRIERFLYIAQLTRRKLVIKDDHVNKVIGVSQLLHILVDLLQFAFAHVGGCVRRVEALYETLDALGVIGVG